MRRAGWLALACLACLAAASGARFELDAATAREVDAHAHTVRRIVDAATREHAGETYAGIAGARVAPDAL